MVRDRLPSDGSVRDPCVRGSCVRVLVVGGLLVLYNGAETATRVDLRTIWRAVRGRVDVCASRPMVSTFALVVSGWWLRHHLAGFAVVIR